MRYANLITNDIVNGEDICVSLWLQGCPHRCPQCHNPETWNFQGGKEIESETLINNVISAIGKNDIQRNLSILGGEPLVPSNFNFLIDLFKEVRKKYPTIKIFLWTGYEIDEIKTFFETPYLQSSIREIFYQLDYIIVGRFEIDKRDITLKWRGSSNQRIIRIPKVQTTSNYSRLF